VSRAVPRSLLARVTTAGFLLLAFGAQAEEPDAGYWRSELYDRCPDAPPPTPVEVRGSFYEPVEVVDGGQSWLLPPDRAARAACLMETCRARNVQLEAGPPVEPLGYVIAAAVGMAAGLFAGAYLVWRLKP
jgi:hypothetical protein